MTITIQQSATQQLSPALTKAAKYIMSQQSPTGAIPWFDGHFADPWDHIEAAMGLTIAGKYREAQRAYLWLVHNQERDGSWYSEYHKNSHGEYAANTTTLKQTHHAAYIATGLWHYYLCTQDVEFIRELYPRVEAAFDFILPLQTPEGEFNWAVNSNNDVQEDALITACSSILKSLSCASLLARVLNFPSNYFDHSYQKLQNALSNKPHRFDRTWEPKTRFSMDWFYPIFCGALTKTAAKTRLESRWHEFVVDNIGCRCVSDEPWVTTAETCELIFALLYLEETETAQQLFHQLLSLQDSSDGGFWTGIVTRDMSLWPKEKTTWTAGAILLAADALFQLSNGHEILIR